MSSDAAPVTPPSGPLHSIYNMANASTDGPAWVSQIQLPVPQLGDDTQEFADCAHRTSRTTNAKRIIVCCDGTWNNSNKKGGIATNVARLSSAIAHKCCTGMPQVVYYHRGAGTEDSTTARILGGMFGQGVHGDIADIYRFVCDNYNPGDEIFILGFSRGAFTARSVAGLICNLGLLNRVGLSHFGPIFHDYQNFPRWRPFAWFDKREHLTGFTLSNYERLERFERAREGRTERRDNAAMEADLDEEKKRFFKSMTQCRDPETGQMDLQKMARKYRGMLEKHEMILCERQTQVRDGQRQDFFVPLNVKVKAVGQYYLQLWVGDFVSVAIIIA
ncbi:Uncharacterized protein CTA2_12284, partial [Colletotrichum tanaceti]